MLLLYALGLFTREILRALLSVVPEPPEETAGIELEVRPAARDAQADITPALTREPPSSRWN